jgi:glycosyltransferase involved in cell wall biosynthesis
MKLVFVCNEYPPRPHGGIGTFVQTAARALHARGHRVTIVGIGENDEEHSDDGIQIVTLRRNNLPLIGNLISRLHLRSWLSSRVEAGDVDVIEVPDYQGLLPFGINGCVVVIRLHLTVSVIFQHAGWKVSKGISFYERRTLGTNTNWIAVSDCVLDLTRTTFGISPKKAATIYNPAPLAPSQTVQINNLPANYVLYAGQLSRRKGALALAEAARLFMNSHPDVHLVYVGGSLAAEGPPGIEEQICATVGIELAERVHFLGHRNREEVFTCMKGARVFAFPSRLEALPLVPLEAMICGLPVVCSNCPPGPEIVEDGVTGLLVDPTSATDISEKISRLLDDPLLAIRLADNARKGIAERFSVQQCVDATEQFYRECLAAT